MNTNTTPSGADALQEGSTVYVLNAMGANRWWASVQPGQDDEGKRTSDDECKQIAHAIRAALSAAQEAPAGPTRQQIIDWLDALDIEVTDKQLAGLFDVVAMETTQDAPACLSKTSDYETQSTLPLTDAPQCRLAAQAVPQDVESLAINRYRPVPSGVIAYKVVAGDGERTLFFGTKNECQSVARRLTEAFLDGAHVMLAAAPAAPQPAAQQGEIAWSAIPATVRRDVTMLAGYAEGSKSAEIVNAVRRVIDWLNADRIAAQAQEAAPAAQGELSDPLQDAANRLLEAVVGCNISTLRSHLKIDFSQAKRLMDAARAAQKKGGAE